MLRPSQSLVVQNKKLADGQEGGKSSRSLFGPRLLSPFRPPLRFTTRLASYSVFSSSPYGRFCATVPTFGPRRQSFTMERNALAALDNVSPELAALEALHVNTRQGEWRYEMRREAQEILPGLLLGPFQPSVKLPVLHKLGITHVVCITEEREKYVRTCRYLCPCEW